MLLKKLFTKLDPSYMNALSRAGTVGLHMVSGIMVGVLIGVGFDKWLDTRPWGTVFFSVVGIIAGFKNVYTDTKRLVEDESRLNKNKGSDADKPTPKK